MFGRSIQTRSIAMEPCPTTSWTENSILTNEVFFGIPLQPVCFILFLHSCNKTRAIKIATS